MAVRIKVGVLLILLEHENQAVHNSEGIMTEWKLSIWYLVGHLFQATLIRLGVHTPIFHMQIYATKNPPNT